MQTIVEIAQIAAVAVGGAIAVGVPLFLLGLGFGKLLFAMTKEDD